MVAQSIQESTKINHIHGLIDPVLQKISVKGKIGYILQIDSNGQKIKLFTTNLENFPYGDLEKYRAHLKQVDPKTAPEESKKRWNRVYYVHKLTKPVRDIEYVIAKSEAERGAKPFESFAVDLILYQLIEQDGKSEPYVFLIKRTDGAWAIPGGMVDPGETFREAALREVEEESGIPRNKIDLDPTPLTQKKALDRLTADKRFVTTTVFTGKYLGAQTDQFKPQEGETTAGGWFKLDQVPNPLFADHQEFLEKLAMKLKEPKIATTLRKYAMKLIMAYSHRDEHVINQLKKWFEAYSPILKVKENQINEYQKKIEIFRKKAMKASVLGNKLFKLRKILPKVEQILKTSKNILESYQELKNVLTSEDPNIQKLHEAFKNVAERSVQLLKEEKSLDQVIKKEDSLILSQIGKLKAMEFDIAEDELERLQRLKYLEEAQKTHPEIDYLIHHELDHLVSFFEHLETNLQEHLMPYFEAGFIFKTKEEKIAAVNKYLEQELDQKIPGDFIILRDLSEELGIELELVQDVAKKFAQMHSDELVVEKIDNTTYLRWKQIH